MARTTKAALQAENELLRTQLQTALDERAQIEHELESLRERHADSILGAAIRAQLRRAAANRGASSADAPPWLIARRALIAKARALVAQGKTVLIRGGALIVR